MTDAERLQDHLARLRAGEPIVALLPGQALAQAKRLHEAGVKYAGIADVMARYHGVNRTPYAWKGRITRSLAAEREESR
jgi:hypothetical protein